MLFIGFANSLTAVRARFRSKKLTSRYTILHWLCNSASGLFGGFDERKVLAGCDRMAGRGVAEVMNPQLPERRIATNRPPGSEKIVLLSALGEIRK